MSLLQRCTSRCCLTLLPTYSFEAFVKHSRALTPVRYSSGSAASVTRANEPFKSHFPSSATEPAVHSFFHKDTSSFSYVVVGTPGDAQSALEGVIIDSVLDFDPFSGRISTSSANSLLSFCSAQGVEICAVLETHAHADHLSAGRYITNKLANEVPLAIGKGIEDVQQRFASRYGFHRQDFANSFDMLLDESSVLRIGASIIRVLPLPGHTPDHVGYVIGKNVFTGDVIFQPDVGSARADFPGGDAQALHQSIKTLMQFSDDTRIYVGHDYPPAARANPSCFSTVAETRTDNIHLQDPAGFVEWRAKRDSSLSTPKLLHPSLQVNLRGGRLPARQGRSFLQIPLSGEAVEELL